MCSLRFDAHIMMGLVHGKVSECTARLALAQGMIKVRYRIAGNFEGENFHGFRGLRAIRESFLHKIWECAAPTYDWFQAIRDSFLREILTSYGSTKVFSLESLPLYGIIIIMHVCDL